MSNVFRVCQSIAALAMLIVASGCASVPPDHGRGVVDELVAERGRTTDAPTVELVAMLTERPLTAESAVRIALINNPDLQSSYASLGFGAADVYEAGRIRNPAFSGSFLGSNAASDGAQITLSLVVSFTDLITLRSRSRLSRGAFAALQQEVGGVVLGIAAKTERAYYRYVGAQQVAAMRGHISKASTLSAALAQRYLEAGNLTARHLAMEKAAASEARLKTLEADMAALEARTDLAGLLGISAGDPWKAPAALHPPLEAEDDLDHLIKLALETRLDLAAARTRADVLSDRLGVVSWTRWLGDLDAGIERERETDGTRLTGPAVSWEVPIFNQHQDALVRANTDMQLAINQVRRITLEVENGIRLAYAEVEAARARIEEFRTKLIPMRLETVERAQEELNFMLIGIFELIALKQDEYDAYQGYLEAITDYWLGRADLAMAAGRSLPSSAQLGDQIIDVEQLMQPEANNMDKDGMDIDGSGMGRMDHSGHQRRNEETSSDTGDESPNQSHQHHNKRGES